jgi:hypothetical protein
MGVVGVPVVLQGKCLANSQNKQCLTPTYRLVCVYVLWGESESVL